MLLVRRRAPEGSFFEDGDRAAGVFGVIATGFAVLLGLIVFLAFESYDESRAGAEDEARAVEQQFETAQFMPAAVQARLSRELTCYARYVVYSEWPRLEAVGRRRRARGLAVGEGDVPHAQDRRARRRSPSRPHTTSGSTAMPIARPRATSGSTELSASSQARCGWSSCSAA